jgi:hypothetical protein
VNNAPIEVGIVVSRQGRWEVVDDNDDDSLETNMSIADIVKSSRKMAS